MNLREFMERLHNESYICYNERARYIMENKTYKDFGKEYIGASDIASLILVGFSDAGLKLFDLQLWRRR